jgi:hypothetical protein
MNDIKDKSQATVTLTVVEIENVVHAMQYYVDNNSLPKETHGKMLALIARLVELLPHRI